VTQIARRLAFLAVAGILPLTHAAAQAQAPRTGADIRNMIIEDSLTPAKAQLRNYVAELRDSLVKIESAQENIARARKGKMPTVVLSQGRQLGKYCAMGVSMVDLTTERISPMGTPDPRGDQALHGYRSGLNVLREDLRICAHIDSVTLATQPVNQDKLETIATAVVGAIRQYDQIRDGMIKVFDISLPIHGDIRH